MENFNIALVDDQELVRKGFRLIISSFSGMSVLFEANSGVELLRKLKIENNQPDLILLDLSMKEMDGVDTAKKLVKAYPDIHVAILSMHYTTPLVKLLVSLNACAYFKKNTKPKELEQGLRKIMEFGSYFNEEVLSILREEYVSKNSPKREFQNAEFLTEREEEVLELICQEYNTKEIADIMNISYRTVETHRRGLLNKTKSRNIAGLVIYAISKNLFSSNKLRGGNNKYL